MSEKKKVRKERLEYIAKRSKELHLSKNEKRKKIKAELLKMYPDIKESTIGWETWNFFNPRKEKKAK